jgi:hypothetical protein
MRAKLRMHPQLHTKGARIADQGNGKEGASTLEEALEPDRRGDTLVYRLRARSPNKSIPQMIAPGPDRQIAERIREFFRSDVHWTRALWRPGLALLLSEVLEAFDSARAGLLSEPALATMCRDVVSCLAADPAISNGERGVLINAVKGNHTPAGVDYETIRSLAVDLSKNYLRRLSDAVRRAPAQAHTNERTARATAAHLLDHGFSSDFLHRWCTGQIYRGASSLAELIDSGANLVARGEQNFKVLVAFDGLPENETGYPGNYINGKELAQWLRQNGQVTGGLRQNGGLLLSVVAREPNGAASTAAEIVRLLEARCSLGAGKPLKPAGRIWVESNRQGALPPTITMVPLIPELRPVRVRALHRESKLYVSESTSQLDAVFELLATMRSGAPGPAASSGWAAVEALVTAGGDKDSMAAERLASIVACSYPRSELTDLAYAAIAKGGLLSPQLRAAATNKEKAEILAKAIKAGAMPTTNDVDAAAAARIKEVLDNPKAELDKLQCHFSSVLQRLYRSRNLVLHGGRTDAAGLRPTLRAAAPIVGAGVDRIAHAWFVQQRNGLQLSSHANVSLGTVGEAGGPSLVDLLE